MKSFTYLAAAITAASLTHAAPAAPIKREIGGVFLCTGANATGVCQYQINPLETCVNITEPFKTSLATFAVDGESFYCYPYSQVCDGVCISPQGCTLGAVDFSYPNKYNMTAVGWNTMGSYKCHAKK